MAPLANQMEGKTPEPLNRSYIKRQAVQARAYSQRLRAPPHPKPQFRLRDNRATTIMPMPRHRILILIAAFPSRSPRYTG
jgi:hypothetical protein